MGSVLTESGRAPWISLLIGCILMLGGGTGYLYPLFGPALRDRFGFSQTQVNFVASCQKLASGMSFLSGAVNDRYGPRVVSLMSVVCSGAAYFLLWSCGRGYLPGPNLFISALFYLEGVGSSSLYYAGLAFTNVYGSDRRGFVMGVLVSALGLAAAVWSRVYSHFFQPDVIGFFGFMSTAIIGLGTLGFFQAPETVASTRKPKPLVLDNSADEHGPQIPPMRLLRLIDFWILVIIVFILTGSGATVIVNLGSMVLSAGGDDGEQNILVFYLSLANCAGRLLFGWLVDYFNQRITKVSFLTILSLMMAVSQFYFVVFTNPSYYWMGTILVGLAYGGVYCIFPNIVLTMFGQKNFGKNLAMVGIAPGTSTLFIASLVAGQIYETYAGDDGYCVGTLCFGLIFLSNFSMCICATLFSVFLNMRLRTPLLHV